MPLRFLPVLLALLGFASSWEPEAIVHLATAMATWAARHGHSCADLGEIAGTVGA